MYSKMGGRGEPQNSKNFPWWAAEFGKRRRGIWQNLPRKVINYMMHIVCVLNERLFSVLILESTNRSVICITPDISHSFCTEFFLVHKRTEYIADITAGKTGYRPSADIMYACHWTTASAGATVFLPMQIDTDAKISVSTHLWFWSLVQPLY